MNMQPQAANRRSETLSAFFLFTFLFAVSLIISLSLNWPTINSWFFSDDISLLAFTAPQSGAGWLDCLKPFSIGFWRPLNCVLFRSIATIFGLNPIPYHVLAVAIHAFASALTGLLALALFRGPNRTAWLATLLTATHAGAFGATVMLANSCDSLLAIGLTGGLLAWDRWLAAYSTRWLVWTALAFCWAAVSKETAIIFPVLLILWTLLRLPVRRQAWTVIGLFGLAALIYGGWAATRQAGAALSYSASGTLLLSPKNFLRQLADYYDSSFVPFLHVMQWPWISPSIPHWAYWILRLMTLAALALAGWLFVFRPRYRGLYFTVLAATTTLILPSLLGGKPQGRFIYPAIPFACLTIVGLVSRLPVYQRKLAVGLVTLVWLFFATAYFVSPTVLEHRQTTDRIEKFMTAVQRIAPQWEPGSTVSILNHPYPEVGELRWVYAQLLFNIAIPERHITLALDRRTSNLIPTYQFTGSDLIPIQ